MGQSPSCRTPYVAFALCLALAATLPSAPAIAAVVINEILPNPVGTADATDERVEIYNTGPDPVNMTGWCIEDAATIDDGTFRSAIPENFVITGGCSNSVIIGPGEFRVLNLSTSGSGTLNNTVDDVYLCSNRTGNLAAVVNSESYPCANPFSCTPPIPEGYVWACIPNGSESFAWRDTPTLCASNGGPAGDVTPPATVSDLVASPGLWPGEIKLTWTAPGDDGATGTASAYIIKVSASPINLGNFAAATDLDGWLLEPVPSAGGAAEELYVSGFDPNSTYYFALQTQDEVPNASGVSNSPSTAPHPGFPLNADLGYSVYFGNLHSHTGYSDGVSTPAAAYAYARNTAPTPLDFLAVTEHNHVSAGMQYSDWAPLKAAAAAANDDGNFVAIFGQEWGLAANGHVNIFETEDLFGWDAGQYDVFTAEGNYPALYTAVANNPPVSSPVVMEWCHPAVTNFADMVATPDGLAGVHLMALVNGPADSPVTDESAVGNTGFDDEFQTALNIGYRVSPTADQDNHNANWGSMSQSRTAVLAAGLTKSGILGALAVRRNYATQDHNVAVQVNADGQPMGAVLTRASGIRIAVSVTDPDLSDSVAEIDLLRGITGAATASVVASNTGSSNFSWRETETFAPGTEAHYYVRIRQADNQNIWTGPIYVTYDPAQPVSVDDAPARRPTLSASPYPSFGHVTASFALPRAEARAELIVVDASGRRVATLLDGPVEAGAHQIDWAGSGDDGRPAAAGLYFLKLRTADALVTGKALLIR